MTNCKFCNTSILEHPAGSNTDTCIAQAQGKIIAYGFVWAHQGEIGDFTCWHIPVSSYSTDLNHAIEFAKFVCTKLNAKYDNAESCRKTTAATDSSMVSFGWFETVGISRHSKCIINESEALATCIAGFLTLEKMKEEEK